MKLWRLSRCIALNTEKERSTSADEYGVAISNRLSSGVQLRMGLGSPTPSGKFSSSSGTLSSSGCLSLIKIELYNGIDETN